MSAEAERELAHRILARRNVAAFATYVDPDFSKQYRQPHALFLFDLMQKASDGTLWDKCVGHGHRILTLSLPPGHYKTSIVNKFVAWFIGSRKTDSRPHQVALVSYSADLAESSSRTIRDTIASPRYQTLFPTVRIHPYRQSVARWALEGEDIDTTLATGVGGPLTGHRAHLLVIDDPIKNPDQANSLPERERQWVWLLRVALTRLTAESIVIIPHTRWHEDDITGRIIKVSQRDDSMRVVNVRLPALAETDAERHAATEIFGTPTPNDPLGRKAGDALCPTIATREQLEATKKIDYFTFFALFQGVPQRPGGNMVGRANFVKLPIPPTTGRVLWCIPTDWAITKKQLGNDPDFTAMLLMGLWWPDANQPNNVNLVIAGGHAMQETLPNAERGVVDFAMRVRDAIGKRPTIVGAVDTIDKIAINSLSGYPELADWPIENIARKQLKGDKVNKSSAWRSRATLGRVYIVDEAWWGTSWQALFWVQIESFPTGTHDDYADTLSVGNRWLSLQATRRGQARQMEG